MALIEQEEAAKLIRQNKDTHEDCQGTIHYNIGCEHSAQIVERMEGIDAAETVPAIPLDWIRGYINRLKDMGVVISIRDAQAVSVMVDKYMMEQYGNATCGPDYCEIGGQHD